LKIGPLDFICTDKVVTSEFVVFNNVVKCTDLLCRKTFTLPIAIRTKENRILITGLRKNWGVRRYEFSNKHQCQASISRLLERIYKKIMCSGCPTSVRTSANIEQVEGMIRSRNSMPHSHKKLSCRRGSAHLTPLYRTVQKAFR